MTKNTDSQAELIFNRRAAEIRAENAAADAYRQTPEGKAEYDAWEEHQRRMADADARAWAQHQTETNEEEI